MRSILLLLVSVLPLAAGPADTVLKLFDCMAKHDAAGARGLFTPGTNLTVVAADGKTTTVELESWLKKMGEAKVEWKERMWNPTVLEHGPMAVVWAPYDFHLGEKFSHCGIDMAELVKTGNDWKIRGLSFTRETSGCEIH